MYTQKLLCILVFCISGILGSVYDTTLFVKKYLESEIGFQLNDAQMAKHKVWKNGVVPYYIEKVSFDKPLRDEIRRDLHETGDLTGIAFMELDAPPEDKNKRYVFFINRANKLECDEHTITGSGAERIVLGFDCLARKVAIPKAVMAILSIPPQHNSPDRDKYIKIATENILEDKKKYFNRISNEEWLYHEITYDFSSITHYTYFQYSKNGAYTIIPHNYTRSNLIVGEGTTYSEYDVWKIALLYNYIIGQSKVPGSQCSKLFKAGANYTKIEPDKTGIKNKIVPRKLPYKYLGKETPLKDETNKNDENNEIGEYEDLVEKDEGEYIQGDGNEIQDEGGDIQDEGGDINDENENLQDENEDLKDENEDLNDESDNINEEKKNERDGTHIFRKNNFIKSENEKDHYSKDDNKTSLRSKLSDEAMYDDSTFDV